MATFLEFVEKKERESLRHLKLLKKLFESQGFDLADRLKEEEPYLYVRSTNPDVSFGGVRVYSIGGVIAFRPQQDEDTHPYGRSYGLDVEGMFAESLAENKEPEKAGKAVIEQVSRDIKKFFDHTAQAQDQLRSREGENLDGSDPVLLRPPNMDYTNLTYSRN